MGCSMLGRCSLRLLAKLHANSGSLRGSLPGLAQHPPSPDPGHSTHIATSRFSPTRLADSARATPCPVAFTRGAHDNCLIHKDAEGMSQSWSVASGHGAWVPRGCPPMPRAPQTSPGRCLRSLTDPCGLRLCHLRTLGSEVKEVPALPAGSSLVCDLGQRQAGADPSGGPRAGTSEVLVLRG